MATPIGVSHSFVSGLSDGPDLTQVQPSGWNAQHVLGGTSFPVGPAAGQLWFHDTYQMWFRYDGTRWLCTCPHTLQIPELQNLSANASSDITEIPNEDLQLYITKLRIVSIVSGTTNGTNFWTVQVVYKTSPNTDNNLTGASISTAADAGTTYTKHAVAVNQATAATWMAFYFTATKTLTPGNFYCAALLEFRYIGT